jgi:hypothetical protein
MTDLVAYTAIGPKGSRDVCSKQVCLLNLGASHRCRGGPVVVVSDKAVKKRASPYIHDDELKCIQFIKTV